jgi:tetratricopeptide (TPR) repeat protein
MPFISRYSLAIPLAVTDQTLPLNQLARCLAIRVEALGKKDSDNLELDIALMRNISKNLPHPELGELASRFGTAWSKRNSRLGYSSDDFYVAVEFFSRTKHSQLIRKLLDENSYYSEYAIIPLICNGQVDLAYKIFGEAKSDFLSYMDRVKFTRELEKSLPQFLEKFPRTDAQLVASALFNGLADSKDPEQLPLQDRSARLKQLFERFSQETFRTKSDRELVLAILASENELSREMFEELKSIAKPYLKIASPNGEMDDTVQRRRSKVLGAFFDSSIRQGDLEPLIAFVDNLTELADKEWEYSSRNWVNSVAGKPIRELSSKVTKLPTEQVDKLKTSLKKLIANDKYSNFGAIGSAAIIFLVVSNQQDQVQEFVEQNPDGENSADLDSVWKSLATSFESMDAETRKAKIIEIWKMDSLCKLTVGSDHFRTGVKESCSGCRTSRSGLDAILDAELITPLELLEIAPQLAEVRSIDGEIWRQVGHYYLSQDRFSDAAAAFQKAVDDTAENGKQALQNRRVELAFALHRSNKSQEAAEILAEVDSSQLVENNIECYAELKGSLNDK